MTTRCKLSLVAATAVLLGTLAWSSAAKADPTPGCGGDGQSVCTTKPARSHGKAKTVGCPAGSFVDPRNFGECWTCSDKVRTVHAVTSASACGRHVFDGAGTRARFVRSLWGCGAGQFLDVVDGGSCWSCPAGTHRGFGPVKSASACPVSLALVCDAGMESAGDRCRPSRETQVRTEAAKALDRHAQAITRAIELALGLDASEDLLDALGDRDARAIAAVTASRAFRAASSRIASFETITVGAATSASLVVVGGSAETGIAIDIESERPVFWYGGAGYQFGPGLGAEAGLSVGLWTAENNALGGDSQGVVLGVSDLAKLGTILGEGFDFKAGASVAVALWFSYPDARGNIELQGVTVTPSISAGVSLGSYVKSTTVQLD